MIACICPVCGGRGLVPKGFYDVLPGYHRGGSCTVLTPEQCRSCGGQGFVWKPETRERESYSLPLTQG